MNVKFSARAIEIADHARFLLAEVGYNGFSYADLSARVHTGGYGVHVCLCHAGSRGTDDPGGNFERSARLFSRPDRLDCGSVGMR